MRLATLKQYEKPAIFLLLLVAAIGLDHFHQTKLASSYEKGKVALKKGKLDSALYFFADTTRQDPDNPAAHLALAQTYESKGWTDQALSQYEIAELKAMHSLLMVQSQKDQYHQQAHKSLEKKNTKNRVKKDR
ncbi:MAG: tetratricopeptide repeat protein [Bdellovibrionota bacterium]